MSLSLEQVVDLYDWYNNLENRLRNIIDIFPITNTTSSLEISTPRFVSILVESSSIVDSLFRKIFPPKAKLPSGKEIKREDAKIMHYYSVLEPTLKLTETYTLFMAPLPIMLHPFEKWSGKSSPDWWKLYNNLKHNRLSKTTEVGLRNTLDCLCALHQLMTKVTEILKLSLRFGWINSSGFNPKYLIELLEQKSTSRNFLTYTNLFCTPIVPVEWKDETDIKPIKFDNADKLITYLGRMY